MGVWKTLTVLQKLPSYLLIYYKSSFIYNLQKKWFQGSNKINIMSFFINVLDFGTTLVGWRKFVVAGDYTGSYAPQVKKRHIPTLPLGVTSVKKNFLTPINISNNHIFKTILFFENILLYLKNIKIYDVISNQIYVKGEIKDIS